MDYQEKITLLEEEDFVALFSRFGAEPRWVTSAGKRAIQILGLCHAGENHSALFDPDTLKVHCFSECNGAMLLHTWVKRTLGIDSPHEAKERIMDWIADQDIDFSGRVVRKTDFEYTERKFDIETPVEMVKGMPQKAIDELYVRFDADVLAITEWAEKDGIDAEWLNFFDVRYDEQTDSIMLPHHNIEGEIVGIYQRSFRRLRREVKKDYPDMPYEMLMKYPRAKYVPMLRHHEDYMDENLTSWSFPNSRNLYGLHLAAPHIAETGKAIIFEGGKSVMLAHQYGFPYAVATHTFGAHLNHIAMLYACGARQIYLAFDKQYKTTDPEDDSWQLYERKTRDLAKKVGDKVRIYRIRDCRDTLDFKDSPIDRGQEAFEFLWAMAENLSEKPKPKGDAQSDELTDEERREVEARFSEEQIAHFKKLREALI